MDFGSSFGFSTYLGFGTGLGFFGTDLSFGSVFGVGSGLFSDLDQILIVEQNWVFGTDSSFRQFWV